MNRVTSFAMALALFGLTVNPSWSQEESDSARIVASLESLLEFCETAKKCGDLITKITVKVDGKELNGVKLSLPERTVVYYRREMSYVSGGETRYVGIGCWYDDLVSANPKHNCLVYLL